LTPVRWLSRLSCCSPNGSGVSAHGQPAVISGSRLLGTGAMWGVLLVPVLFVNPAAITERDSADGDRRTT